ncbi:hypothetical protein D3C76_1491750 [compost metagenome]
MMICVGGPAMTFGSTELVSGVGVAGDVESMVFMGDLYNLVSLFVRACRCAPD